MERHKNSFSTYLTYIHTHILLTPIDFFLAIPILQKLRLHLVWFLFGATSGVDSYSRHFDAINKMVVNKNSQQKETIT